MIRYANIADVYRIMRFAGGRKRICCGKVRRFFEQYYRRMICTIWGQYYPLQDTFLEMTTRNSACKDIMQIRDLCDDKRCQTIGYIGDKDMFTQLILSGVKGVDRVVPLGKTMDFDLIWDGYDLTSMLTRIVDFA